METPLKSKKDAQQKPTPRPSSSLGDPPTDESIASLAYLFWEKEGRPAGRDVDHWLQAEVQLRSGPVPEAPPGD